MKPSRYNHIVTLDDGTVLIFNCISGALVEIEHDQWPQIKKLIDQTGGAVTEQDRQYIEALVDGGYIVDDDLDEAAAFMTESRSRRAQGTTLALTIAPTLACNFNCDYCFEDRSRAHMPPEVEQAILDFTDRKIEDHVVRLRVCWFGGEPTLRLPTITRMQTAFQELTAKRGIEFPPALIISNGFLLDGDVARKLRDINITDAQVTLDGPESVHDKRRVLHSGKGTFRRIVDNLAETAHILNIRLRVNVDRNNVESAYEVISELGDRGILPAVNLYFAQVKSYGDVCANVRDRCFCEEDFSRGLVGIYRRLLDMGVYKVDYPKVYGGVFCAAVAEGTYVISPRGLLFRCWEEISDDGENSIGTIFSSELTDRQQQNLEAYRAWDPFALPQCAECDILPLCLGGCPRHGMIESVAEKGLCSPWRFNLNEMLQLRYRCQCEGQPAL